jgi:hypothetical protein
MTMATEQHAADMRLADELLRWRRQILRDRLDGRGLLRALRRAHTHGQEPAGVLLTVALRQPDGIPRAWGVVLAEMARDLRAGKNTGHEATW